MHKDRPLRNRTATIMDMNLYNFLTNRVVADLRDTASRAAASNKICANR